jgi:hypothetical protein
VGIESEPHEIRKLPRFASQRAKDRAHIGFAVPPHANRGSCRQLTVGSIGDHAAGNERDTVRDGYLGGDMRFHIDGNAADFAEESIALQRVQH